MSKAQVNLQDLFLNQVRKDHVPVTIYLIGGVQLKGLVKGFDAFTVLLDSPGKPTQIVYKHAVASVVPIKQVNMPAQEVAKEEPSVAEDAVS
jgi:host factor-I protein